MNNLFSFQTSKRIIAGNGSLKQFNEQLPSLGNVSRALIVTSGTFKENGSLDLFTGQLSEAGVEFESFIDIQPEPTVEHIEDVFKRMAGKKFDLLIGLGGGSVLDATKLLSVMSTNDIPLKDMVGTDKVKQKGIPMVLIPTTSGTGSEVTPNAIVTFPEEELKIGVVSRHLLPDLVILDPTLTLTLPPRITAATGMDAFVHSFESFISNKANPISDMFALESMRLISRSIIKAYEEGSDLQARHDMLLGSTYGGMALTAAGTAAVHALAYPLGGKFNIPHGEANSMLLPHVTLFNLDHIEERMAIVARELGMVEGDTVPVSEAAQVLINKIQEWTERLNIPQKLEKFGIKEEDVPALATAASKVTRLLNNNPKKMTIEDMEAIYRRLLK
ncbi:iron-containing alcohol dehydrogenase [Sutcliffiella deserti]|uniref:iron-containing alcohol dehydrogenase n=1 Tax=Sutcliffiella deserti TaxID=2875501 RepID=UPI001CBE5511|nr:iron-containing alcohol dehydrogenase [Sutcliffiella deserti]